MDSLLDFSESDDTAAPSGGVNARDSFHASSQEGSHDPFDPFATQHDIQPNKVDSTSDPFDPFATITSDPTSPDQDFFGNQFAQGNSLLEPSTDQLVEQNQSGLDFFGTVDDSSNHSSPDLLGCGSDKEAEPAALHQDLADFLGGPTMETAVDTQMNGHIANGDVTHEERTESHVTTTSTTEVTTSSGFSSESRTITSEQHTMSEEHSEYREETQAAPGSAAMSCTRGSVSSESQDNPTPSVSISPPTSERQSATESGYDDMMGDFGEGLAPKADMDSELDLTPAVTPQDRSRDHEVPNGSHTAEDCSDIEMEEKAGGGSPQAGAEGSSDEEETRTFIEKDLSVPDHLEDMVMTAEESPLQEDKNSNNNPIVMEQAAEETKKEVENEDPDEKDIDDREDSVIEVESVTIDLDGKDRDGNEIKQMCDEADDGEVSNVASSGSGDRHEMEPRGAHAHPDSSSDEEHIPEKDVSKVTLASRVLEAERDGYISSEDERMIDHDEHDDGEQNTKLKATGGTEANPNQEIEVQSDDSEAEQPVPASSGTHASSSKQEAGYISSEEERSVEHYEHDDKVEEQATQGHVTHVRNPSSDVPEASGGAPQEGLSLATLAAADIQVSAFKVTELWPPQDPAKRMDAREAERRKSQASEEPSEGGGKVRDEKKSLDYMKERFQVTQEKSREKIIREPKKLDIAWGKEAEGTEEGKKEGITLPREQDLVTYTTVGLDYSKQKYEHAVERKTSTGFLETESSELHEIPVNKQVVEKVAPPEITRNVLALFESGEINDTHRGQKINPLDDLYSEGSVCESQPQSAHPDIIRNCDKIEEGTECQKGYTRSVLAQWENKGKDTSLSSLSDKGDSCNTGYTKSVLAAWESKGKEVGPGGAKQPITMDLSMDQGCSENQPETRPDLIRESDISPEEAMAAMSLKDRMAMLTTEKPRERKQIKLIEDGQDEVVLENEPDVRDDVIRASDKQEEVPFHQVGHIKNLSSFFDSVVEQQVERKPIIIDRSSDPVVRESEPAGREEGIVHGSDKPETDSGPVVQRGHAAKLLSKFSTVQDGVIGDKKPFKMDLAEESGELESTPEVNTDVVRCNEKPAEENIEVESGRSKKLAEQFLQAAERCNETRPSERRISIDREAECVVESTPEERDDVVKSGGPSGWEIEVERGRTRSLADTWLQAAEECTSPRGPQGDCTNKPAWLLEMEAAKEAGVYENEPEERDGVAHGGQKDETTIPEQHTRNLKNMWMTIEAEQNQEKSSKGPELIRFTPPREVTPPPDKQRRHSEGVSFEPCVYMQSGMEPRGQLLNGMTRKPEDQVDENKGKQMAQKKRQARPVQKRTPARPIPPPSDAKTPPEVNGEAKPPAQQPRRESLTSSAQLVFKT